MHEPLPDLIEKTRIFARLSVRPDLVRDLEKLRATAGAIGKKIEHLLPEFTDHSVRHMDALWSVADTVLSDAEAASCTPEEIFILACSFYVHDLGMATGCTMEGVEQLRGTASYAASLERLSRGGGAPKKGADALALQCAARELHAELAPDLMLKPFPGLQRYLIEDTETRSVWGPLIGEVAASHHWALQEVEDKLGRRGRVPVGDGGAVDLAFVACVLRVTDFAHLNHERAVELERRLRPEISAESSLHWDAQANITGPDRDLLQLVYGCTAPVKSVDAWWLLYDMVSGLDREIRSVRDYLEGRRVSAARFSLLGVRGTESPESFSAFVRLDGEIAPIDIRIQPSSMEKVIDLLGGPALYRDDRLAPVRELIQNSRDAIELRNAMETVAKQELTPGRIEVSLDTTCAPAVLRVRDNGVGMTRTIVKNHLISVGSDFWRSAEFARDFVGAATAGFKPIGRFGIGFLSVFMLGNNVEVETERAGHARILLRLRGVGRRGELIEKLPTGRTGTEIRIELTGDALLGPSNLSDVVKARAPMLPYGIWVETVSADGSIKSTIEPKWWARASSSELYTFLARWRFIAKMGRLPTMEERRAGRAPYRLLLDDGLYHSNLDNPELLGRAPTGEWPGPKPEATEEAGRLVESGSDDLMVLLRCSQGIAIDTRSERRSFGLVEIGDVELPADRSLVAGGERRFPEALRRLTEALVPRILQEVDQLEKYGSVPSRYGLLRSLAERYGDELLDGTALRWIPTIEQPGNLVHRSRAELQRVVEAERCVVVASGLALRSAYGIASRKLSEQELARTVIILLPFKELSVSYEVGKHLEVEEGRRRLRGKLGDIVKRVGGNPADDAELPTSPHR
jgi:hypothetical protein